MKKYIVWVAHEFNDEEEAVDYQSDMAVDYKTKLEIKNETL